jgi:hypothetical protein
LQNEKIRVDKLIESSKSSEREKARSCETQKLQACSEDVEDCLESDDEDIDFDIAEFQTLLSILLTQLKETGVIKPWIQFHKLVNDGKFPLNNIAFWYAGYRLFYGKFLRCMGGITNQGQILDGSTCKGQSIPSKAKINFAVQDRRSLDGREMQSRDFHPGVLHGMIKMLSMQSNMQQKPLKICFDGKKINASLSTKPI